MRKNNEERCDMIKRIFKYSTAAILVLSVTGKVSISASQPSPGVMMAQTTEPSVGHRTDTPIVDHIYKYKSEQSGIYELRKTPLPGFKISISGRTWESDKDNDDYGAGEKIETFRSLYRVDSSGNEIALEKDIFIDFSKAEDYNYLITEADAGSKIKMVYIRKSTSASFTPLPNESYPKTIFTNVVSSPLVPVKPVLYVDGVERADYVMYPNEVGYLRYQVKNRDNQPVWNIDIYDAGFVSSDAFASGSSTININGEVERKIIAKSVSYPATVSVGASYMGYDLWTKKRIDITVKPRP